MLNPGKPSGIPAKPLEAHGRPGGNHVTATGPVQRNEEAVSPVRVIAFRMALVLVFINFSNIHQLLTYVVHVNFYLLYLFGIPTLLGVVLAGGIPRTFRGRPAVYWGIFVLLMIAGVPFSSWKGGSFQTLIPYLRTVFPMLFVIAGVTLTWRECRSMMWSIASGGVIIMLASKFFQDTGGRYGDRLAIEFGTISNSNDYAVHLLFVLPFVIWAALSAKLKVINLAAWSAVGFGILLVLKTASRGGLVGIAAGVLYWLIRGTMRQRIGLLVLGPVLAVTLIAFVPQSSLMRLVAFSASDEDAPEEAIVSSDARRYLLRKSIEYTLEHPVFGVGMDQFSAFEGERNIVIGDHGMWHDTHNSYTQISSECGLPALAFYIAAIVCTFRLANKAYRRAGERTDCEDIRIATFCIMLAMTTYCAAITFVNFGYFFYLLLMSSLVIAVSNAANLEFDRRAFVPVGPQQHFAPQRRRLPGFAPGGALGGGRAVATTKNTL